MSADSIAAGLQLVARTFENLHGRCRMTSTRFSVINLAVVCVAFLSAVHQTSALSYEVCESYGAEWITDSPRLTGKYPYYSLLFFCNGDLMLQPA